MQIMQIVQIMFLILLAFENLDVSIKYRDLDL